jgi:sugar phosphate isomerase/epimerase
MALPKYPLSMNIFYLLPLLTIALSLSARTDNWPIYAFQNGVHFKTVKERIKVLKQLGYHGIGSAKLAQSDIPLPQRLKHYDEAELKLFSFYIGGKLTKDGHSYSPEIKEAIKQLKGYDTVLELFIQGNKQSNNDDQAVAFVREIADQAKDSGLRVVLYPHANFYIDRVGDAVRIARKSGRDNVGVMFNLCHFLKVEPGSDLRKAITNAAPLLWQVSINGADKEGTSWEQLIQTLDQGDFDHRALLQMLHQIGFKGNIGFQCYAIRGNSQENLKRSIDAWKKLNLN